MMKKRLVFFAALCSVLMWGCSDPEKDAQIALLTNENAKLSAEVQTLQNTLDSLNDAVNAKKKSLSALDMHAE